MDSPLEEDNVLIRYTKIKVQISRKIMDTKKYYETINYSPLCP